MEDLATKIGRAEEELSVPRNNIAARRVAIEGLAEAFTKLDRLLRFTFDPLMEMLRATDSDAYTHYISARRVIVRPGSPADESDAAPPQTDQPLVTAPLAVNRSPPEPG